MYSKIIYSKIIKKNLNPSMVTSKFVRYFSYKNYRDKYNDYFSETQKKVLDKHPKLVDDIDNSFEEVLKKSNVNSNSELRTLYAGKPTTEKSLEVWEIEVPDPERRRELIELHKESNKKTSEIVYNYEKLLTSKGKSIDDKDIFDIQHVKRTVTMLSTRDHQERHLCDKDGVNAIHRENEKQFAKDSGTIIGRCPDYLYDKIQKEAHEKDIPFKEVLVKSASKKRDFSTLKEQLKEQIDNQKQNPDEENKFQGP